MGKDLKPEDQEYKARSTALRLLARREHSRLELSLKLRQRAIAPDVIDRVMDEYEKEGWLSDERFADVYARQRIDLGYGPLRILAELQQRGISQSPECLDCVSDSEWSDMAIQLRERRFGLTDLSEDWNEKARQARFLYRRGFEGRHVEKALDRKC